MLFTVTVLGAHKHEILIDTILKDQKLIFKPQIENCGVLSFFDHRADLSSDTIEGALEKAAKAVETALLLQRGED